MLGTLRLLPEPVSLGPEAGYVDSFLLEAGCGVADNAEYFRFAEVLASYAYGNSPQSGKPPH
jgi:hypothetical protein